MRFVIFSAMEPPALLRCDKCSAFCLCHTKGDIGRKDEEKGTETTIENVDTLYIEIADLRMQLQELCDLLNEVKYNMAGYPEVI